MGELTDRIKKARDTAGRGTVAGYGLISRLSEKTARGIVPADLQEANFEQYFTSRIWRAGDVWDLMFRILVKPYYAAEYWLYKPAHS